MITLTKITKILIIFVIIISSYYIGFNDGYAKSVKGITIDNQTWYVGQKIYHPHINQTSIATITSINVQTNNDIWIDYYYYESNTAGTHNIDSVNYYFVPINHAQKNIESQQTNHSQSERIPSFITEDGYICFDKGFVDSGRQQQYFCKKWI